MRNSTDYTTKAKQEASSFYVKWTKLALGLNAGVTQMYFVHDMINIHEAKTHFSEVVNAASEGREIFITKAGKPVAKLVPLKPKN